jgi:hypothetical protein
MSDVALSVALSKPAAHNIPEILIHEILSNVAFLDKERTWVQTININIKGVCKGRVRLNKHSKLVRSLTNHIHEKARQCKHRYIEYIEMYRYSALNTEEETSVVSGWATYHPILLNIERNPGDSSKEYAYIFFENDPSSFAWICHAYSHSEADFVFERGILYSNNQSYSMIMKKEGFRLVQDQDQDQDQEQQEWFESFDVYLLR